MILGIILLVAAIVLPGLVRLVVAIEEKLAGRSGAEGRNEMSNGAKYVDFAAQANSHLESGKPDSEPREPAAREARIQWMCVLEHPANNQKPNVMTEWVKRTDAEAYSAELRAAHAQTMADYLKEQECRVANQDNLRKSEARIQELQTADIQRAKDITRLTVQRDEYLETGQRIQGDFERARAAYEASERSLLQAQDLWDEIAVELDSAGIPASEPAPEGGLNFIATSNRVKMLIEKLASTSPQGGPKS